MAERVDDDVRQRALAQVDAHIEAMSRTQLAELIVAVLVPLFEEPYRLHDLEDVALGPEEAENFHVHAYKWLNGVKEAVATALAIGPAQRADVGVAGTLTLMQRMFRDLADGHATILTTLPARKKGDRGDDHRVKLTKKHIYWTYKLLRDRGASKPTLRPHSARRPSRPKPSAGGDGRGGARSSEVKVRTRQ